MSFLDDWNEKSRARHEQQVIEGLHDDACEWRPNGHHLCHCSKRKREADGYTEPPGELIFNYPECPGCGNEVEGDGDGFNCYPCKATWSGNVGTATFTDDYGDLDPTPWDERAKAAAE